MMLLGWIGFILIKKIISPTERNKVSLDSGQKMVACEVCDTHIPESDAIIKNGKTYCSKEHSE
ncbi:metallothionein [Candidatus Thioglobus sp.]|nr:metallothionein [Candidatus Thioglobus sp.]